MCYPEKCPHCGKTGWAGCGQHVDDVMRSVPAAQRCTCSPDSDRTAEDPRRQNTVAVLSVPPRQCHAYQSPRGKSKWAGMVSPACGTP